MEDSHEGGLNFDLYTSSIEFLENNWILPNILTWFSWDYYRDEA